jgi:hypothetical protein
MGTILSDEVAIRFNYKFVSVSVLHIQWMQPFNVVHKRVGHTSEWVKILHILPSTINCTSNIEDIETKQIAL